MFIITKKVSADNQILAAFVDAGADWERQAVTPVYTGSYLYNNQHDLEKIKEWQHKKGDV